MVDLPSTVTMMNAHESNCLLISGARVQLSIPHLVLTQATMIRTKSSQQDLKGLISE